MTTEDFTRQAAALVAANDRVPPQRRADLGAIGAAGTLIEIEGGVRFVSNGVVWLLCDDPGPNFRGMSAPEMNARYMWWVVGEPA